MQTKKIIALLLGAALTLGLLAGCSKSESDTSTGALSSFTADTMDSGTFTQKDLAAKDATIVHFWATFCTPCLAEMPELATYAKALPEHVQFITICLDGADNLEDAKSIMEKAGYEGITLLSGDNTFQKLCESIQAVPTTIFVNSKGEIVGDPVIGGQPSLAALAANYTAGANRVLKEAGKAEISVEIQ